MSRKLFVKYLIPLRTQTFVEGLEQLTFSSLDEIAAASFLTLPYYCAHVIFLWLARYFIDSFNLHSGFTV